MTDYYSVLGVDRKASLADIKKAYRKLARKYHPDLNPGDKVAEKRFKDITEAYEVLKDPEKKRQYDTFGGTGPSFRGGSGPEGGRFDGFDFNSSGNHSFGDLFETLFGAGFGQPGRSSSQQNRSSSCRPSKGEDLRYAMTLSFADAAQGIETPIQLVRRVQCSACKGQGAKPDAPPATCRVCNGTGKVQKQTGFMRFASPCQACNGTGQTPGDRCSACGGEGRTDQVSKIRVRIPAGVDDGGKVRIGGKGNDGVCGGPAGDLIITVRVEPHAFFRRSGLNLEMTLPITFTEAALGAKVEVPTLDGQTILKIPPGMSSGRKWRIKGKGMPDPKGGGRGDLILEVRIVPPPTEDLSVRELLKKLEQIAPYKPRQDIARS